LHREENEDPLHRKEIGFLSLALLPYALSDHIKMGFLSLSLLPYTLSDRIKMGILKVHLWAERGLISPRPLFSTCPSE
jgi:hypothetical protein